MIIIKTQNGNGLVEAQSLYIPGSPVKDNGVEWYRIKAVMTNKEVIVAQYTTLEKAQNEINTIERKLKFAPHGNLPVAGKLIYQMSKDA